MVTESAQLYFYRVKGGVTCKHVNVQQPTHVHVYLRHYCTDTPHTSHSQHHSAAAARVNWSLMCVCRGRSVAEWFNIVGWQHAVVAGPLHAAVHPAVVNQLRLSDTISLHETHLITVRRLVLIHCHVHHLSIKPHTHIPLMCTLSTHTHTHPHNHFTALWILSGTNRVSQHQKKHSPTHTYRGHKSSLIS